MTLQFGVWDPVVQSGFFDQMWRPGHCSIIMSANEAIGILAVCDNPDLLYLSEILIRPPYQGRGIGSAIIADLIEQGRKRSCPVRLQVLKRSRAQELYARLGFVCYQQTNTHLLFEKRHD